MSTGSDRGHNARGPENGNEQVSWRERPLLVGIGLLLLLFVLPSGIWWYLDAGKKEEQAGSGTPTDMERLDEGARELARGFEKAVKPASPTRTAFLQEVEQLQASLKKLEKEATSWQDRRRLLLDGDAGRGLAAEPDLVREFAEIDKLKRSSPEDVQQLQERLAGFVNMSQRMKEPFSDEDDPSELASGELKRLGEDVAAALQQIGKVTKDMMALEQKGTDPVSATTSLAEALEAVRRHTLAAETEELLRKRKKESEKETDKYVGDAIKAVASELGKSMLKSRDEVARLEREKRRLEDEAERKAHEQEQARVRDELQREYDRLYPAMKGYLTVFTSHGYTQRIGGEFRATAVRKPVSYSRLVNAGLLNEGEDSLRAFWNAIDSGTNDRELGAFPAHSFSSGHVDRHYETVLRIHAFLRRFGALMALNGDLAP